MGVEYLNNNSFESIIARFQKAKKEEDTNNQEFRDAQDQLAECFYLLADHIIEAFRFQLIDKDDALQEGVMICFEKLDRFKQERGKAFNYMTTVTLNHYRQLYRAAKNYNELKKRFAEYQMAHLQEVILTKIQGKYRYPAFNKDSQEG